MSKKKKKVWFIPILCWIRCSWNISTSFEAAFPEKYISIWSKKIIYNFENNLSVGSNYLNHFNEFSANSSASLSDKYIINQLEKTNIVIFFLNDLNQHICKFLTKILRAMF